MPTTMQKIVMTSLKVKDSANVTQNPMLEMDVSSYKSNEKSEIRELIAGENDTNSFKTGQMTMSVMDNDFVDIDWTPDAMSEHFHALQK